MSDFIAHPKRSQINKLKQIWHACFSDNNSFVDSFFKYCFESENALCYYVNDNPVSMLFMLDAEVHTDNKKFDATYLYAVATLPQFQKKGIMRKLEEEACVKAAQRGKLYSVLIPQNKQLFNMYEKIGYKTAIYKSHIFYKDDKVNCVSPVVLKAITQQEMLAMRKQHLFSHQKVIKLNSKYDEFLKKSNEIYNVNSFRINDHYFLGFKNNDEFEIIETSIPSDVLSDILPCLFKKFGVSKISVKSLGNFVGEISPYGMVKSLNLAVNDMHFTADKPLWYMNLMLD